MPTATQKIKRKTPKASPPKPDLAHIAFSAWEQGHYALHGTWPEGWHCRSKAEREVWRRVAEAVLTCKLGH